MSYNILLLFVNPHATTFDTGITTKTNTVTDIVTEVDVVTLLTNVSNYTSIIKNLLSFSYFYSDFPFPSFK